GGRAPAWPGQPPSPSPACRAARCPATSRSRRATTRSSPRSSAPTRASSPSRSPSPASATPSTRPGCAAWPRTTSPSPPDPAAGFSYGRKPSSRRAGAGGVSGLAAAFGEVGGGGAVPAGLLLRGLRTVRRGGGFGGGRGGDRRGAARFAEGAADEAADLPPVRVVRLDQRRHELDAGHLRVLHLQRQRHQVGQ